MKNILKTQNFAVLKGKSLPDFLSWKMSSIGFNFGWCFQNLSENNYFRAFSKTV